MKLVPKIPFSHPETALFILRVSVGIVFTFHGSYKLFGTFFGGSGMDGFIQYLDMVGVPYSDISAWLAALTEFLCGLALILGIYARWAALPLIGVMAVAIYAVTGKNGFNIVNQGFEYNVILIAALLAIFLHGSEKGHLKQ